MEFPDTLIEEHGYRFRKIQPIGSRVMYECFGRAIMVSESEFRLDDSTGEYIIIKPKLTKSQIQKINGCLLSVNSRDSFVNKKAADSIKSTQEFQKKKHISRGKVTNISLKDRADELRRKLGITV